MVTASLSSSLSWGIVFVAGAGAAIIGTAMTPLIMCVMRLIQPLFVPEGAPPNRSYRVTFAFSIVNSFLTNLLFFLLGVLVALYLSQPH